jgi:hypothetical protein
MFLLFDSDRATGQEQAARGRQSELLLFSLPNFQGRSIRLTQTTVDLPIEELENGSQFDWNDNVRSLVVVSGTWRLFQHGRCNTQLDDTPRDALDVSTRPPVSGWSSLVSATSRGQMEIPVPEAGGLHHDVSSIELLSTENLPDWVYGN